MMEDCRTMRLALSGGEVKQVLLEAGTTLLLVSGQLTVRSLAGWLAENVLLPQQRLDPEEVWVAAQGGWIELAALTSALAVLIPPDSISLWRQVGRRLEAFFSVQQAGC